LRDALFTESGARSIALTALEGMGDIGKTILAQALCADEAVQQAFPDGIAWVTIGRESDLRANMHEIGKTLGDDLSRYDNELGCKNQYRNTIREKAALIVVDDVWKVGDLEPFMGESQRSRLLFTTRDATIAAAVGAREHLAILLDEAKSRELLAKWSGLVRKNAITTGNVAGMITHPPLTWRNVACVVRRPSKPEYTGHTSSNTAAAVASANAITVSHACIPVETPPLLLHPEGNLVPVNRCIPPADRVDVHEFRAAIRKTQPLLNYKFMPGMKSVRFRS
jgi:hypothetical protein